MAADTGLPAAVMGMLDAAGYEVLPDARTAGDYVVVPKGARRYGYPSSPGVWVAGHRYTTRDGNHGVMRPWWAVACALARPGENLGLARTLIGLGVMPRIGGAYLDPDDPGDPEQVAVGFAAVLDCIGSIVARGGIGTDPVDVPDPPPDLRAAYGRACRETGPEES